MPASCRISEQDYVDAMRLFAHMPTWAHLAQYACVAALALMAVFASPAVRWFAITMTVGAGMLVLLRWPLAAWAARRQYRKYKAIREPFTVELREEGVNFASPQSSGTVVWNNILKWRQDERYVLIYLMPRLFHIVPKSVASQGLDIAALVACLEERVGKPA